MRNESKVHESNRAVGLGIDRARLLRDAAGAFLSQPPGHAVAARQFAALAEGFLPQITRDAAIGIARQIAGRVPLPQEVHDAFARIGIRFRHAPAAMPASTPEPIEIESPIDETHAMQDNRFFAGPLMDMPAAPDAATPDLDHLDPYGLRQKRLDAVTLLALVRAAERNDRQDFIGIAMRALAQQGMQAGEGALARMLQDETGEPAALLVAAIGGDRSLLAHAFFAFNENKNDLAARGRQALVYFDSITPEFSTGVLALYFGAPVKERRPAAVHVSVQSGQSRDMRSGGSQKAATRPNLSERLGQAVRK